MVCLPVCSFLFLSFFSVSLPISFFRPPVCVNVEFYTKDWTRRIVASNNPMVQFDVQSG